MILDNVSHDRTEACSTSVILRQVLKVSSSVCELAENIKDAN